MLGSTTPLVVCSMTRCVGGLSATSQAPLMPFMVLASQSTHTMSIVLVSHMVPLANTSGPLPVDEQTQYKGATCVAGSNNGNNIPSFVGQNYFCESGLTRWDSSSILFSNGDTLWDGQGCGPTSSCCTFNSPPWFNVTLPSPTTDDIGSQTLWSRK